MKRTIHVHIATVRTTLAGDKWHSDFFGFGFGAFNETDAFAQCDRYMRTQPVGASFVVELRRFCECIGKPLKARGRCKACKGRPLPTFAVWRGFEGRRTELTAIERPTLRAA